MQDEGEMAKVDPSVKELQELGSDLSRRISDFKKSSEQLPNELDSKFAHASNLGNTAKRAIGEYDSALESFKYGVTKFIAFLIVSFVIGSTLVLVFTSHLATLLIVLLELGFLAYFVTIIVRFYKMNDLTEARKQAEAKVESFETVVDDVSETGKGTNRFGVFQRLYVKLDSLKEILSISLQFTDRAQPFVRAVVHFYELRRFKAALHAAFSDFPSFYGKEIHDDVEAFKPKLALIKASWISEFRETSKRYLGQTTEFFDIFYYTFIGDQETSKIRWNSICKGNSKREQQTLSDLVTFLMDYHLDTTDLLVIQRRTLFDLVSAVGKDMEEFKLTILDAKYAHFEKLIIDAYNRALKVANLFKVQDIGTSDWTPHDLSHIDKDLYSFFARKLNSSLDYFYVISGTAIDAGLSAKSFKKLKDNESLLEFAVFLKERGILETDIADHYLAMVLNLPDNFDISKIAKTIDSLEWALSAFAGIKEEFVSKMTTLESLLGYEISDKDVKKALVMPTDVGVLECILYEMLTNIQTETAIQAAINKGITLNKISTAITATYSERKGDFKRVDLWKQVAGDSVLSGLFYKLITIADAQNSSLNAITLDEAIRTYDPLESYEFISDFKVSLTLGVFVQRESLLLAKAVDSVKKSLEEKATKSDVADVIKLLSPRINKLLSLRVNARYVNLLLLSNKVTAYLLATPPGPHTGIVSDATLGSEKDASSASTFYGVSKHLFEIEKKAEFQQFLTLRHAGGRYTRLGIAPHDQSFEKFKVNFQTLVREVYKKRNLSKTETEPWKIGIYRVFPTRDYMMSIYENGGEDGPIEDTSIQDAIKDMIENTFPDITKMGIIASIEGIASDANAAIRDVISECVRDSTLIDVCSAWLSPYEQLKPLLENASFKTAINEEFFKTFGTDNDDLIQLSSEVTIRCRVEGEEKVLSTSTALVTRVSKKLKVRNVAAELLSSSLIDALRALGEAVLPT